MTVTKITKLTAAQRARMPEWRDKWIKIGLSTERMDLPKFTAAVKRCYGFAQLSPPRVVVPVSSPRVMALATPIAAHIVEELARMGRGTNEAVRGAVDGAVRRAVDVAVDGAVRRAVDGAVDVAVRGAVRRAVDGAVDGAVRMAVDGAVRGAVDGAVGGAVGGTALKHAIQSAWMHYIGGQFWVGSFWGSPAQVSFYREVCGLTLGAEMDARAIAYQATAESACWWWPHTEFVMVSDRPTFLHRDIQGQLHCEDGPAIGWSDGFGLWAWHGAVVTRELIEKPIDPKIIGTLANAEHNRVALERYGVERYVREYAQVLDDTHPHGKLVMVQMDVRQQKYIVGINGTPGPDGVRATYVILADNRAITYREATALSYPTLSGEARTAEQYHLSHGRT